MRRGEVKQRLEAAREWDARGLLAPQALKTLEAELETVARADRPSLAMQTFYALGGLLLGGATAALYALLRVNDVFGNAQDVAWWFFAAWAALGLGAGAVLHRLRHDTELGDALLLAGLVPTTILLGPEPVHPVLWAVVPLAAVAVLALRWRAPVLGIATMALIQVSVPVILVRELQEDPAGWFWFTSAIAFLAAALVAIRNVRLPWHDVAALSTAAGVAIAWTTVVLEIIRPGWTGGGEVLVALVLAALLGLGLAVQERGVLFAAGGGLTIDAVVFAFDVGDVTWGLITLLVLGGGLLVAATRLRRPKSG